MELRRTATTLALAVALGGGMAACNGEEAGRAVDKGAKKAKEAGKKAAGEVEKAGKKAADKADKAVDSER